MDFKKELQRKFAHLFLILIPIAYLVLGKWTSLIVFASLTLIILPIDYLRQNHPKTNDIFNKIFGIILRDSEKKAERLCGASWVGMSACLNFAIFESEIAVTAFMILVFSDLMAAIIGKKFPSGPFFEKSQNGSLAFFVTGFLVLLVCGNCFDVKFGFYFFGLIALFFTTIIEARPSILKIDDNFTIPISFSVIMSAFYVIWYYQW